MKLKHCIFSMLVWLAACANTIPQQDSLPTLDLSSVGHILPTLPPDQIAAYARLADAAVLAEGQMVYIQHCAACHGLSGEGQFPDAPLAPDASGRYGAPPHDETGHTWHHDDNLLLAYVRGGGQGDLDLFYPMPPFEAVLNDEQIEAVIAYIKSLWTDEQRLLQAERTLREAAQQ